MRQIHPDLWQTSAEHPFGPGMSTHAYLLTRTGGNILFYSSGHADEYFHILHLGGIARQYLSHRDEAGAALLRIRQMFGSTLCCHKLEEPAVSAWCPVDLTFSSRESNLGEVETIPTPGHTIGSTCFMCRSSLGKCYLFAGVTIFPEEDSWGIYVSADQKDAFLKSLGILRSLKPHVVISSASSGPFSFREMRLGEWSAVVDSISDVIM